MYISSIYVPMNLSIIYLFSSSSSVISLSILIREKEPCFFLLKIQLRIVESTEDLYSTTFNRYVNAYLFLMCKVNAKVYKKRAINLIRCYIICRINISTVHEPKWQQQIIKLSMQLKSLMEQCTEKTGSFLVTEQWCGVRAPPELMAPLRLFLNTLPVMHELYFMGSNVHLTC